LPSREACDGLGEKQRRWLPSGSLPRTPSLQEEVSQFPGNNVKVRLCSIASAESYGCNPLQVVLTSLPRYSTIIGKAIPRGATGGVETCCKPCCRSAIGGPYLNPTSRREPPLFRGKSGGMSNYPQPMLGVRPTVDLGVGGSSPLTHPFATLVGTRVCVFSGLGRDVRLGFLVTGNVTGRLRFPLRWVGSL